MKISKPWPGFSLVLALAAGLLPFEAHAYIDIGTGSMLLQLLIGGIAGGLVVIKIYWSRLRRATARMIHGGKDKAEDRVAEPD